MPTSPAITGLKNRNRSNIQMNDDRRALFVTSLVQMAVICASRSVSLEHEEIPHPGHINTASNPFPPGGSIKTIPQSNISYIAAQLYHLLLASHPFSNHEVHPPRYSWPHRHCVCPGMNISDPYVHNSYYPQQRKLTSFKIPNGGKCKQDGSTGYCESGYCEQLPKEETGVCKDLKR
ncbi:predicted protein [Histoplasma capsulatum G186AR]|uniref:Uncharacterized protein n=1 Tax=Ajellomyces capsulatus (strain G186AR / H82 / ATCC MYA-2454 / RMSCC 2432) TaxID=447093 RepID=C0NQC5_AJECG|nr:uncharacterized protein HCBG_05713 [Histoplasma capsulatum G186AR]EEH06397.1 predicted protein [Histoplasma capsulatum G186AR]